MGRISNPSLYDELYLADTSAGAIAETFGNKDVWSDTMFDHPRGRYALANFELDNSVICDLGNAEMLVSLRIKPSRVVTKQRAGTQAWRATIFGGGGFDGICWWSNYDADWASFGIWSTTKLRLANTRSLAIADGDVAAAASTMIRSIKAAK